MTPEVRAQMETHVNEVVPQMHKADLKNIEETDNDEVFHASEEMTFEWIEMFLSDVNRIERFFVEKKESLINEFIAMQEKFRLKSYNYEDKKKRPKNLNNSESQNDENMLLQVTTDRASQAIDDHDFFDTLKEPLVPSTSFISDTRRQSSFHTIRYSEIDKSTSKEMPKFYNKADLLDYAEKQTGERKLTSFLIPDIAELKSNLKLKNIKHVITKSKKVKDEFEHMVNWKRVFEQIW